jgi:DNA polymerase
MLKEHCEDCRRCVLGGLRTQSVFGVGDGDARLVFVGEGPGRDEDAQGIPFVGRAGQKLTSLIEKLGLRREQVYITNVVKCRPPENRTPEPAEIAACHPYLERQLLLGSPRVIVALGLAAAQTLLGLKQSMGQLRKSRYRLGDALVIATYHPAYVLRNPKAAWDVWDDVKDIPELLRDS